MTALQLGYKAPMYYDLGGALIPGLKGVQHSPLPVLFPANCTMAVLLGVLV